MAALAPQDEDVLNCIFSRDGMIEKGPRISDEELGIKKSTIPDDVLRAVAALEVEGIKLAEEKKYDEAIAKFSQAITQAPTYQSAYNNRAFAYQKQGKTDLALSDVEAGLAQTPSDRHTLSQLYIQRGMLRRLKNDEDGALADMAFAGKLGSVLAKQEAVRLNPYAALCNQMLSQAFKDLKGQPVQTIQGGNVDDFLAMHPDGSGTANTPASASSSSSTGTSAHKPATACHDGHQDTSHGAPELRVTSDHHLPMTHR